MPSKSAIYYNSHPEAKAKKHAYNKTYQAKPSAVKKRVEANAANRKAKANGTARAGDGRDWDHHSKKMVKASTNRGRAEKSRVKGSKRG